VVQERAFGSLAFIPETVAGSESDSATNCISLAFAAVNRRACYAQSKCQPTAPLDSRRGYSVQPSCSVYNRIDLVFYL
jgi:hypothetical protein